MHVKYIELVRPRRRPFAPCGWVLSAHSLQSLSAWSASTRRRSRSCRKTKMLVRSCIHFILIHTLTHIAAKSQLTKANQTKIKMENLARELQKVRHVLRTTLMTWTKVLHRTTKGSG